MKEVYDNVEDLFSDRNVVCGILRRMKCHYDLSQENDILQHISYCLIRQRVFERYNPNLGVKQLSYLCTCIRNCFLGSPYIRPKADSDIFGKERVGLFESGLESICVESESRHDLEKYFECLNETERELISGIITGETIRDISKRLGFTGSRGGQLVQKALEKIRKRHFTKYSVYSSQD